MAVDLEGFDQPGKSCLVVLPGEVDLGQGPVGVSDRVEVTELFAGLQLPVLRSDKTLNGLNQSIFSKLFDNRARRDLIAGHKAWLAYRHAFCQSESDVFEGGTEAGVLFATCEAQVNSEHVKDLKTFLADLSANAG